VDGNHDWYAGKKPAEELSMPEYDYVADRVPGDVKLKALADASDRLVQDFGSWRVKWGAINRFQRNNGDIVQKFDDDKPSTPVPFTASTWGSLAAFKARRYEVTKRYYGTSGNSFVAVVEFADKVHAMAVTAGGESGHSASPHFDDEAVRLRHGRTARGVFLPGAAAGPRRAHLSPGRVTFQDATSEIIKAETATAYTVESIFQECSNRRTDALQLASMGTVVANGSIPSRATSFGAARRMRSYLNFNFKVAYAAFAKKIGIGPHFPPGKPLECQLE
jgi:Penicillin amidase